MILAFIWLYRISSTHLDMPHTYCDSHPKLLDSIVHHPNMSPNYCRCSHSTPEHNSLLWFHCLVQHRERCSQVQMMSMLMLIPLYSIQDSPNIHKHRFAAPHRTEFLHLDMSSGIPYLRHTYSTSVCSNLLSRIHLPHPHTMHHSLGPESLLSREVMLMSLL